MTYNEILDLKNRHVDAAVAVHVFGHTNVQYQEGSVWGWHRDLTSQEIAEYAKSGISHAFFPLESYSTQWDYASRIVVRMSELGYAFFRAGSSPDGASATFTCQYGPCKLHGTETNDYHGGSGVGASVPEAISKAAIAAVLKVCP